MEFANRQERKQLRQPEDVLLEAAEKVIETDEKYSAITSPHLRYQWLDYPDGRASPL